MGSRLTIEKTEAIAADYPAKDRQRVRTLLACRLIRQELRAIRRDLGIPANKTNLSQGGTR